MLILTLEFEEGASPLFYCAEAEGCRDAHCGRAVLGLKKGRYYKAFTGAPCHDMRLSSDRHVAEMLLDYVGSIDAGYRPSTIDKHGRSSWTNSSDARMLNASV